MKSGWYDVLREGRGWAHRSSVVFVKKVHSLDDRQGLAEVPLALDRTRLPDLLRLGFCKGTDWQALVVVRPLLRQVQPVLRDAHREGALLAVRVAARVLRERLAAACVRVDEFVGGPTTARLLVVNEHHHALRLDGGAEGRQLVHADVAASSVLVEAGVERILALGLPVLMEKLGVVHALRALHQLLLLPL